MKSQSALEFITIVGFGLIIIAVSSYFGVDYILSYQDSINAINAEQMVNSIVSAVNFVYSQGVGSQTKVFVTNPAKILLNRTYINGSEINLRFFSKSSPKDVFGKAAVNITGSIPIYEGRFTLYAKMSTNRTAILLIDAPVSYITVNLFNNSGRTQHDNNFTAGETVYYSAFLYDFNDSAVDSNIEVNVYKPDMSQFGSVVSTSTTSGSYNGSFALTGNNTGSWLVSVTETNVSIIGTTLFNKY